MNAAAGAPVEAGAPAADVSPARLLLFGRADGQLLDDLVVAPLRRVVAHHLQHEVEGLFPVALRVEFALAGDAAVLRLPDRRRHVFAAHLPALGRAAEGLERDGG